MELFFHMRLEDLPMDVLYHIHKFLLPTKRTVALMWVQGGSSSILQFTLHYLEETVPPELLEWKTRLQAWWKATWKDSALQWNVDRINPLARNIQVGIRGDDVIHQVCLFTLAQQSLDELCRTETSLRVHSATPFSYRYRHSAHNTIVYHIDQLDETASTPLTPFLNA